MSLSASTTFDVADAGTVTELDATVIVQPAAGAPGPGAVGIGGRITHPTLGVLDYYSAPDETVNLDRAGVVVRSVWERTQTLGGQVDALWPSFLRDARVIERWKNADVGCPISHLRLLAAMAANPPDPADGLAGAVIWEPTYATATRYAVIIADVRAGGSEYTIDWFLESKGYAPSPVELELRILGLAI